MDTIVPGKISLDICFVSSGEMGQTILALAKDIVNAIQSKYRTCSVRIAFVTKNICIQDFVDIGANIIKTSMQCNVRNMRWRSDARCIVHLRGNNSSYDIDNFTILHIINDNDVNTYNVFDINNEYILKNIINYTIDTCTESIKKYIAQSNILMPYEHQWHRNIKKQKVY